MARRRIALSSLLAALGCGDDRTGPTPFAGAPPAHTLSCIPNLDGRIDASEVEPRVDATASFLVSTGKDVDLAGSLRQSGQVWWDFSLSAAGDALAAVRGSTLEGSWYRDAFPDGEFAVTSDAEGLYESVYAKSADALLLFGIASVDDDAETRTLLVYQQPVEVARLPLEPGVAWRTVGEIVGGRAPGIPAPFDRTDTYDFEVVAAGRIALPEMSFSSVLRLQQSLTIEALGAKLTRRQSSFVAECVGEVARASSGDGETEDDFTHAAEVRRLSLQGGSR
jgi:hypothetical protein